MHRTALVLGLLAVGLLIAACGGGDSPGVSQGDDLLNGRELFINGDGDEGEPTCGSCHTLAAAGTNSPVGPDLDTAFQPSREQGFEESTFEQVVRAQIAYPGVNSVMPPNLVTGEDADDVAYFIAQCAGQANEDPQCAPPPPSAGGAETGGAETGGAETGGGGEAADGAAVFAEAGCASCHTLAAAGASGTIGPNLDEAQPSQETVVEVVTNGRGAMPSFRDQLSEEQIQAVADYVSQNAGG